MTKGEPKIVVRQPFGEGVVADIMERIDAGPNAIESIKLELVTGNGEETESVIRHDGPDAGVMAYATIPSIPWDGLKAKEMKVWVEIDEVAKREADEADEADEDEDEDGEVDKDELDDDVQAKIERVEGLNPDTNKHAVLTAFAEYYRKVTSAGDGSGSGSSGGSSPDAPAGVSTRALLRVVDVPMPKGSFHSSVSNLVNEYGALDVAEKETDTGGERRFYSLNAVSAAYLAAHGAHSEMDADVGPAVERYGGVPAEDGGEKYSELRKSAQERDMDDGGMPKDTELFQDEPHVDGPQPITTDSRFHEVLWELKNWHDENGYEGFVTGNELFAWTDTVIIPETSVRTSLSKLFLEYAVVDRQTTRTDGGHKTSEYQITEAGIAELKRKGEPAAVQDA
jgi:hypothetical protein